VIEEAALSVKRSLPIVLLALTFCSACLVQGLRANLSPVAQGDLSQPRIYAYRDWQSVGVRVEPGDRLYLRARGRWLYTPGEYHGPEGHREYRAPNTYPMPGVAGGVLLGRVGETGQLFIVARGGSFSVNDSGVLYLRINDDILSDNEGYVTVEVEVDAAGEP
jgi:hypothetical protein